MSALKQEVEKVYGNKTRLRVCGICIQENKLLVINHLGLGVKGNIWAPPGGGVDFGSDLATNLKREFKEEAGLEIEVKDFLFINEYIKKPIHALELFFKVEITGGYLKLGIDPEMKENFQILKELKFMSLEELKKKDPQTLHNAFNKFENLNQLLKYKGYISQLA
jgi:8-oxo-dGTP diphosphatase